MHDIDLSPANMPYVFNDIVSNATRSLPPLTSENDEDFLRESLVDVVDFFWDAYISVLPQDAQQKFSIAIEENSKEKLQEWRNEYANFETDLVAIKRGKNILETIAANLPQVLVESYKIYNPTLTKF